jgi:hypothetical protein
MQTLQQNYATNFGNQQQILKQLNSVLAPIVAAGPDQTGFSPSERAAFNTQAIDTTGAASANAQRAIANETAGRNDSGNLAEAGNVAALKAGAASASAGQLSAEQLGITEADYATGRANFQHAVGAEQGVAAGFNPLGYAGAANTANATAFGEANDIQQQVNQEQSDIAGAIATAATGVPINIPSGGGSSPVGGGGGGGGGGGYGDYAGFDSTAGFGGGSGAANEYFAGFGGGI